MNNMSSLNGGVLYLEDSKLIVNNKSEFNNNTVSRSGGALVLSCISNFNVEQCNFNISDSSFYNNSAEIKGGAIHYNSIKPLIEYESVLFIDNYGFYGSDVSSYSYSLGLN
jgi:hypothetical protein